MFKVMKKIEERKSFKSYMKRLAWEIEHLEQRKANYMETMQHVDSKTSDEIINLIERLSDQIADLKITREESTKRGYVLEHHSTQWFVKI